MIGSAAVAVVLAERDYADVVLFGTEASEPALTSTSEAAATAGSDIAVIASEEREDVAAAAATVKCYSPDAIVVVSATGCAEMCHVTHSVTRFPRARVVGALFHPARVRSLVAAQLGLSAADVAVLALGDASRPAVTLVSVSGAPLERLAPQPLIDDLEWRPDAPARAAACLELVDAIVLGRRRLLSCAALCEGEYGVEGLVLAVPVQLGAEGIEQIVELTLDADESARLDRSVGEARALMAAFPTA